MLLRTLSSMVLVLVVGFLAVVLVPGAAGAENPCAAASGWAGAEARADRPVILGPFLGHVGHDDARVWARADVSGAWTLWVSDEQYRPITRQTLGADAEHDFTLAFHVAGLTPATRYLVSLRPGPAGEAPKESDGAFIPLRTFPDPATPQRVRIAFGSCIHDPLDRPQPVWSRVLQERPDVLCLLGDTPYIDSMDLACQRARYRAFFSVPEVQALRRVTPTYATWDDHDYGLDDAGGELPAALKGNVRRAFVEYHAHADVSRIGADGQGVFSSFRAGCVEVFLLDDRWFRDTEPAQVDPAKRTFLGAAQWAWLKRGLVASDAPYKVIVSGVVMHDALSGTKADSWKSYPHERGVLYDFLAREKIPGVVLVTGDIHRSRVFAHRRSATGMGYELIEAVASPLGSRVHREYDTQHPDLLFERGQPRVFVIGEFESRAGEGAGVTFRFVSGDSGEEFHRMSIDLKDLTPAP